MIWLLMGFIVLSAAGSAYYVYSRAEKPKTLAILRELGLHDDWSDEEITPFYKWNWEQAGNDRVSAERIVIQAFQHAKVWLASEDLVFFQKICSDHQTGTKISDDEILKKVEQIVHRTEMLYEAVGEQVELSLQPVFSASETEARDRLKQSGVLAESGAAVQKYGNLELRRLIRRIGSQVLGPDCRGISLNEPGEGRVFQMRGLDVWEHCVLAVRQAVEFQLINRKYTIAPNLSRTLKSSVDKGIIQECIDDIERARFFRDTFRELIASKQISLSEEQVERCDRFFYGWKFAKGIPFKQTDHDCLRDLLSNNTLFPYFRETIIRKIEKPLNLLGNILDLFPRNVIFYGSQEKARSYTLSQYYIHLDAMLSAMALPAQRLKDPPVLIEIPLNEIQRIQASEAESKRDGNASPFQDKQNGKNLPTLEKILGKYQRLYLLENQMQKEIADQRGWLIDVPLADPEPEDLCSIDSERFGHFTRFYCDTSNLSIFENDSGSSLRKRAQFFERLIDTLIKANCSTPGNERMNKSSAMVAGE